MGRINVTSALGQPLKAEVELVADKKEVPSLGVRMASPEAFSRSGLTYAAVLADVKVSIEKRGDGEPYVLLTSTNPIDEPFLDLMLELTWASGRVTRQFTALLDPPSLIAERERQKAEEAKVRAAPPPAPEPQAEPVPAPEQAQPADQAAAPTDQAIPTQPSDAPAPAAEPAQSPQPAPAPVETIGGTSPTLLEPGSALPSSAGSADAYGPVKSGDTLGKIARAHKPGDVSLDQMLVLLFRANPDAFSGKNMNRLKTGKIIQLPTPDQYASVSAADARKEVIAQSRDWNAYREQVAAAAGQTVTEAAPAQQADAGKVAPPAQEKPAPGKEAPKEVLKLSKNEPAAGGAAAGGDGQSAGRVKALEEELVARDKAVKEANDRVAKLEKTVKDLQTLLEIKNKGMADLQKPAAPGTPPQPATPPATPAQAQPATPTPPPAAPTAPPATPAPEAKPAAPPATPAPATPAPGSDVATAPPTPAPAPPKPPARKVAPPPPPPEPSLMDRVLEQPAYLGAGAIALILIGALAVRAVKRRREYKAESDDSAPAIAAAAPAAASSFAATDAAASASPESDEVDPVKEAEIFLAYGRDAQAEELLKEALAANPNRQEVRLLLLQIYAKRKDAKSFEQVARELQQATGSAGPLWEQATALGYQVDPENPRYAAGKTTGIAMAAATSAAAADNVDFNIGSDDSQSSTATDIDLGDAGGSALERTQIIDPGAGPSHEDTTVMEAAPVPDMAFSVELPESPAAPEPEPEPAKSGGLDFDIDLNAFNAPPPAAAPEPAPAVNGLDFDMSGLSLDTPAVESRPEPAAAAPEIDLSGISLDLGGETTPRVSPSGKDDRWYDVQTKFDLAKAYQEMGDKDGAREILKEVLQEGDAEQKSAAQNVLASLDA